MSKMAPRKRNPDEKLKVMKELIVVLDSDWLTCPAYDECKANTKARADTRRIILAAKTKAAQREKEMQQKLAEETEQCTRLHDRLVASSRLERDAKVEVEALERETSELAERGKAMQVEMGELERARQQLLRQTEGAGGNSRETVKQEIETKLLSVFSKIRLADDSEPHEVKGYLAEKHNTEVFDFSRKDKSMFNITNQVWGLMSVSPDWAAS